MGGKTRDISMGNERRRNAMAAEKQTNATSPRRNRKRPREQTSGGSQRISRPGWHWLLLLLTQAPKTAAQINPTTQQCFFALLVGDTNRDDILTPDGEYVRFLNQLSGQLVGNVDFFALPVILQSTYNSFRGTSGGIDVTGSKPYQSPTLEQQAFLESICVAVTDAVNTAYFGGATPPTTAPIAPTTAPIPTPTLAPVPIPTLAPVPLPSSAEPEPPSTGPPILSQASLGPTVPQQICFNAMNFADANRDDFLDQDEYVRFLNRLSINAFPGALFDNLAEILQINFFALANDQLLIYIFGVKSAQTPSPDQLLFLQRICRDTDVAIELALNPPPPTPTLPPTPVPTPPPSPSYTLDFCFQQISRSDFTRDDYLRKEEYVRLLNLLSGNAFLGLNFDGLPFVMQSVFDQLALVEVDGQNQIYVFGLKPNQTPSPEQEEFLERVCDLIDSGLQLATIPGATLYPTASPFDPFTLPSAAPTIEATPDPSPSPTMSPTFPSGLVRVFSSMIISNREGFTAVALSSGPNRRGLDDAYTILARQVTTQVAAQSGTRSIRIRRLELSLVQETAGVNRLTDTPCPPTAAAGSLCQEGIGSFDVDVIEQNLEETRERLAIAMHGATVEGRLQRVLAQADPDSDLTIEGAGEPIIDTQAPTQAPTIDSDRSGGGGGGGARVGGIVAAVVIALLSVVGSGVAYYFLYKKNYAEKIWKKVQRLLEVLDAAAVAAAGGVNKDDSEESDNPSEGDYGYGPDREEALDEYGGDVKEQAAAKSGKNVFGAFGRRATKKDDDDSNSFEEFDKAGLGAGEGALLDFDEYRFEDPKVGESQDDSVQESAGKNEKSDVWGTAFDSNPFGSFEDGQWEPEDKQSDAFHPFGDEGSDAGSGNSSFSSEEDSEEDEYDEEEEDEDDEEEEGDSQLSGDSPATEVLMRADLRRKSAHLEDLVERQDWDGLIAAAAKLDNKREVEEPSSEEDESEDSDESSSSDDSEDSDESSDDESIDSEEKERLEKIRSEVEALVKVVAPEEEKKVDSMMKQFQGRETELVATLQKMQEKTMAQRARAAMHKSKGRPVRENASAMVGVGAGGSAAVAAASLDRPLQTRRTNDYLDRDEMERMVQEHNFHDELSYQSTVQSYGYDQPTESYGYEGQGGRYEEDTYGSTSGTDYGYDSYSQSGQYQQNYGDNGQLGQYDEGAYDEGYGESGQYYDEQGQYYDEQGQYYDEQGQYNGDQGQYYDEQGQYYGDQGQYYDEQGQAQYGESGHSGQYDEGGEDGTYEGTYDSRDQDEGTYGEGTYDSRYEDDGTYGEGTYDSRYEDDGTYGEGTYDSRYEDDGTFQSGTFGEESGTFEGDQTYEEDATYETGTGTYDSTYQSYEQGTSTYEGEEDQTFEDEEGTYEEGTYESGTYESGTYESGTATYEDEDGYYDDDGGDYDEDGDYDYDYDEPGNEEAYRGRH